MKIAKLLKIENFSLNRILFFLLISSSIALCGAYVSQYFFGLKPCILCLYQRIPFLIIVAITILLLTFGRGKKIKKIGIFLCSMLLLINAGIALYHVGIEQKIFKITEKCVNEMPIFNNLEELEKSLEEQSLARCDEPQFMLFKLSMAAWNVIFCLFLASFVGFLYKKRRF